MPAPPGFVNTLAAQTRLSPQVVAAWVQAEGGPTGNPLNIGPGRNYGTSAAAAAAAAQLVNSSHYYAGIRQAIQGGNPAAEIAAIKSSPWDAGHYSNGVLDRTFAAATGGRVPTTAGGAAAGAAFPAAAPGLSSRQAFALNQMNQLLGLDNMPTFHASTGALPSAPQTPIAGSVTAPGAVSLAPGANRAGVGLSPLVMNFVGQVAGRYGQPLTIGTGTNHNEYVQGSHRVSEHWGGYAADIPSSGQALTRLGQAALVAAGASPVWAAKQRGGLFNLETPIGRVQVIFNSNTGGNHFNHLHVGLSPRGVRA